MSIEIEKNQYMTIVFSIIPFFMLVAIDETFNMQSIIVPVILLIFGKIIYDKKVIIEKEKLIILSAFLISIGTSMLGNVMLYQEKINTLYFIRILYTLMILVFFFLSTEVKLNIKQLKYIFYCNIITAIIVAFYLIFINHIWYFNLLGVRIDKNFSAGYLSIVGELVFWLFYYTKNKIHKINYFAAFTFILLGIFYSASRAAILICLLGTVIIIMEDEFLEIKKRRNLLKYIGFTFFFCFTLIVTIYIVYNNISSNPQLEWYWNRYFVNSYSDSSNNSRVAFWLSALNLWSERPIFGYGPGIVGVTSSSSAVAHNTYIDYMVDFGLVGLFAFLYICKISLTKILFSKNRSFKALPISILLFSIILSMDRSVLLWYVFILCWLLSQNSRLENIGG